MGSLAFRTACLMVVLLLLAAPFVPTVSADGAHASVDQDADARVHDRLFTVQVSSPEQAAQEVSRQGYPLQPDPESRFADFASREDLPSAGWLRDSVRVMRFAHITDLQLADDDATSLRCGELTPIFDGLNAGLDGCERLQEEYGDEVMHAMIDVLNAHHSLDPFDYAIHTGDNIDNALENELMRYIDIVEGTFTTSGPLSGLACQPDGQSESVDDDSTDVTDACTHVPSHLESELRGFAAEVPWYSVNGNHDTQIQGNLPVSQVAQLVAAQAGRHFMSGSEYVAMHFAGGDACSGGSLDDDFGHGFGHAGDRLCDDDPDNDAYYAFDFQGLRMIVLDTVHDELTESHNQLGPATAPEQITGGDTVGGVAPGGMDAEQFAWLQAELAATSQPVVIYGHHTIKAFWNNFFNEESPAPACEPSGNCLDDLIEALGIVGVQAVMEELAKHPHVLAFIGGHTHENRVTSHFPGGDHPGFWNIETSGVIDLPQETRIIELWVDPGSAKGFWALDPVGHTFTLAKELGAMDEQVNAEAATGQDGDRRVLLWFDLPAGSEPLPPGPQPPIDEPTQGLAITLLDPASEAGLSHVEEGNQSLRIQVHDAETGAVVDGLNASFAVHQIFYADGSAVAIDYVRFPPMDATGNGTYTTTWDFEGEGTHQGLFVVEDLARVYAAAFLDHDFEVEAGGDGDGGFLGIPSPGLPLLLLALAAVVALARRRQP